ncbi:MAG: hypothetical protein AB2L07_20585 [Thermoanaerobaculaceae bacterium]
MINPTYGEEVYTNLSRAFSVQVRAEARAGRDPAALLTQARAEARRAVERNPRSVPGWLSLAHSELASGRWLAGRGGSPLAALDRAAEALGKALQLKPSDVGCHLAAADAAELRARWLGSQGRDAGPAITEGLAAADRGLATNPQAPHLLAVKGTLTWLAGRQASTAQARLEGAEQARVWWDRAVALNPLLARGLEPVRREAGASASSPFREPPTAP